MSSHIQTEFDFNSPYQYRRTDPVTSQEAARSVNITDLEAKVLEKLKEFESGLTSEELATEMEMSLVTVSPRMRPLSNKNKVRTSDEKRTNSSGRKAIVWVAI